MTIHVLVEGPSEREFLERWAPRLRLGQTVRVHPHQGKGTLPADLNARPDPRRRGLLDQLPATLRGLAEALDPDTDGVLVLVDADDDDPSALQAEISTAARTVAPTLRVVARLAVEETEAFYLGDLDALERAFPDADMQRARAYVPDSVCNTWELFGQIVNDGGGNKVAWAEAMGPLVTTAASRSRSPSFRSLVGGLASLAPRTKPATKRRRYRHVAKSAR